MDAEEDLARTLKSLKREKELLESHGNSLLLALVAFFLVFNTTPKPIVIILVTLAMFVVLGFIFNRVSTRKDEVEKLISEIHSELRHKKQGCREANLSSDFDELCSDAPASSRLKDGDIEDC